MMNATSKGLIDRILIGYGGAMRWGRLDDVEVTLQGTDAARRRCLLLVVYILRYMFRGRVAHCNGDCCLKTST